MASEPPKSERLLVWEHSSSKLKSLKMPNLTSYAWRSSLRGHGWSIKYDCWSSSVSSADCFTISIRLQFLLIWGHMRVRPIGNQSLKIGFEMNFFSWDPLIRKWLSIVVRNGFANYVTVPVRMKGDRCTKNWLNPPNRTEKMYRQVLWNRTEAKMTEKEMIWRMD